MGRKRKRKRIKLEEAGLFKHARLFFFLFFVVVLKNYIFLEGRKGGEVRLD